MPTVPNCSPCNRAARRWSCSPSTIRRSHGRSMARFGACDSTGPCSPRWTSGCPSAPDRSQHWCCRRMSPLPETPRASSSSPTAGGQRAWWWFAADQDLDLTRPTLTATWQPIDDGVQVTITTDVLVRDLTIHPDRLVAGAMVDRQLISLLPGESTTLTISGLDDPDPRQRSRCCRHPRAGRSPTSPISNPEVRIEFPSECLLPVGVFPDTPAARPTLHRRQTLGQQPADLSPRRG